MCVCVKESFVYVYVCVCVFGVCFMYVCFMCVPRQVSKAAWLLIVLCDRQKDFKRSLA